MTRFGKIPVSITLTGEEWTAIIAALLRKELSDKGLRVYQQASKKLATKIGAASAVHELERKKKSPLCWCCGANLADLPNKTCSECQSYAEHMQHG